MEIWQYFDILKKPAKTWFLLKDNTEEKVEALGQLAERGYPALIYELTGLLKDNNKAIRDAACSTVIHLFKKIGSKSGYYNALKHCSISMDDIDLYKAWFSPNQYTALLSIASLNRNGYVREKAVRKLTLAADPDAIRFLVYRLADWVLPVRQAALAGINNYKSAVYIDNLIAQLPLIEWLQKVERADLGTVYQDITGFITITHRDYVLANFNKYPDKQRLLLAKHLSGILTVSPDELKLFVQDRHFLIRSLAIDHFKMLGREEIGRLLKDRSARIRYQILCRLKDTADFDNIIRHYLSDDSAMIRHFARFTLKHKDIDYAVFYSRQLEAQQQVTGAIAGLAEVGAGQYAAALQPYLNDNKVKNRKAAFLALCRLDKESAFSFALSNLDSPFPGLRKMAIDFLSHTRRQETLARAGSIYRNGDPGLKRSMLQLFSNIGGWAAIPYLINGTIDEDESTRQLASKYIQVWKDKAVALFSSPATDEGESIKQVFRSAYDLHESRQYFKTNPLAGLEFYIAP